MAEYVNLMGSEDVSRAGYVMRDAAQTMSQAVSSLAYTLELHQRFMDDWLSRFEAALTAAGFSIVHKDEIHAPSVERAIAVALAEPEMPGEPPEAVLKSMLEAGPVETARASCRATKSGIAAALRELMKEVGR